MTAEALLFFASAPDALALYDGLEEMILSAFPDTRVIVQKSQIAFDCGRRFAFVSLRGKRLVVSFGLGRREDSPRVLQAVDASHPGGQPLRAGRVADEHAGGGACFRAGQILPKWGEKGRQGH